MLVGGGVPLAKHLRLAGVERVPEQLVRGGDYASRWSSPELLLSQSCGYDVLYDAAEHIVPIATPCYAAEGCEGPRYRSFVVVRTDRSWQSFQDVACIDAVVLELLRRNRSEAVANLRAVACTNTALAPPYVTSMHASPQLLSQLRAALQAAVADPELAVAREALLLRDVAFFPSASYSELQEFEQAAIAVGYQELPAPLRSPLSDRND